MSKNIDYQNIDVLVVGAGMVGATTAIGLARVGLRVLIIDSSPLKSSDVTLQESGLSIYTPSFDERSTALSPSTVDVFSSLGIWQSLKPLTCPIERIHVSEASTLGVTRLAASEYKRSALGWVVSNKVLGSVLMSQLTDHELIQVKTPTNVESIDFSEGSVSIKLADEELAYSAKLLVVTDGANSSTARRLGVKYSELDYEQHAIVTNVETEACHENCAYERFTKSGPFALLPLAPKLSSLVWTIPKESSSEIMSLNDRDFLSQVHGIFGDRLGRFVKAGKRITYPLRLTKSDEMARSNLIILGNAAQSLHPVAGQGFNLAMRGVGAFLERIAKAISQNENVGDLAVLMEIYQRHEPDRQQTLNLSNTLLKTFATESRSVGLLRELGLVGLNNFSPFKRRFVEQAMGQSRPGFDLGHNHA